MMPQTTRYLATLLATLDETLTPELTSADARDAAARMRGLLTELMFREDGLGPLLAAKISEARALISDGLALIDNAAIAARAAVLLKESDGEVGLTELYEHWVEAASLIEALLECADVETTPDLLRFESSAAKWERDYIDAHQLHRRSQTARSPMVIQSMTIDECEAFLHTSGLIVDSARVVEIRELPGGYTKSIVCVSIEDSERRLKDLVFRCSIAEPIDNTGCFIQRNEFAMMRALHRCGALMPAPLAFRPAKMGSIGDVTVMEMAEGKCQGDVLRADSSFTVGMAQDLAVVAAKLHRINPQNLQPEFGEVFGEALISQTVFEANTAMIAHYKQYWQNNRTAPSPIIAHAFNWLTRNIPPDDSPARVIHGDLGLHNILFHEGKVSAVLDWETVRLGDPAYELAYLREPLSTQVSWPDFVTAYEAAGGAPIDERAINFHLVARWLRNACLSNAAMGRYDNNTWDSIKIASLAVDVLPVFLQRTDDFSQASQ